MVLDVLDLLGRCAYSSLRAFQSPGASSTSIDGISETLGFSTGHVLRIGGGGKSKRGQEIPRYCAPPWNSPPKSLTTDMTIMTTEWSIILHL